MEPLSVWNPYFTLPPPLRSPSPTSSIDDKGVERQGEGSSWFSSFAMGRSLALMSPGWRAGALISPLRARGPYITLGVES